jgi:hypothetical protein
MSGEDWCGVKKPETRNLMLSSKVVTPVETGVQRIFKYLESLDSGFRRNDGNASFKTFCENIKPETFFIQSLSRLAPG